jgi:hypothetical protein
MGTNEPVPGRLFEELGLDRQKVEDQFDELVENRATIMAMAGMMNPA